MAYLRHTRGLVLDLIVVGTFERWSVAAAQSIVLATPFPHPPSPGGLGRKIGAFWFLGNSMPTASFGRSIGLQNISGGVLE